MLKLHPDQLQLSHRTPNIPCSKVGVKLPTNCKTPKFTQQIQQGFPGIRNSSRNLLAQNILLEKWQMGSEPTYIPPMSLTPLHLLKGCRI